MLPAETRPNARVTTMVVLLVTDVTRKFSRVVGLNNTIPARMPVDESTVRVVSSVL